MQLIVWKTRLRGDLLCIEWDLKHYLFTYTRMCFDVFNYTGAHNSRSRNITRAAAPGQSVLLPCLIPNANVTDWRYWHDTNRHFDRHHRGRHITRNGVVTPTFAERFQLDSAGLLIKYVRTTDQGTYTCISSIRHKTRHKTREIRLFVPCKSAS